MTLTATATSEEDDQGEDVLVLGDGEPVDRRGEVVVEQQGADDRGEQRRVAGRRPARPPRPRPGRAGCRWAGDRSPRSRVERRAVSSGRPTHGEDEAGRAAGDRSARCGCADAAPAAADLLVGDQVDVDRAGLARRWSSPTPGESELGEPAAAAGAEHELGGVDAAGEVEQRGRDVGADDLVVGAAEALDQGALPGQVGRVAAGQAVAAGDVDGEQVGALGPGGDPGGAADQRVALGAAGQGDDDPFAGLPGRRDVVLGRGSGRAGRRPCRPARAGPARAAR